LWTAIVQKSNLGFRVRERCVESRRSSHDFLQLVADLQQQQQQRTLFARKVHVDVAAYDVPQLAISGPEQLMCESKSTGKLCYRRRYVSQTPVNC